MTKFINVLSFSIVLYKLCSLLKIFNIWSNISSPVVSIIILTTTIVLFYVIVELYNYSFNNDDNFYEPPMPTMHNNSRNIIACDLGDVIVINDKAANKDKLDAEKKTGAEKKANDKKTDANILTADAAEFKIDGKFTESEDMHSIILYRKYKGSNSSSSSNQSSNNNDIDNEMLDAVMHHICSLDECKHMKYTRKYFVDHKDPIKIAKDVYARVENIKYDNENTDIESISIRVYSAVLALHELKDFIERLHKNYMIEKKNKLGNQKYFFDEIQPVLQRDINGEIRIETIPKSLSFTMTPFNTFKSIDNIFGPRIKELKERIKLFTENQEWYEDRGIPYTLGIMLYGEPGCGKTSMIKAIAKDTNRHVVNIKLRESTTQQQLINLFFNESLVVEDRCKEQSSVIIPFDKRLYVIEDIDCLTNVLHDRKYAIKMLKKQEREIQHDISKLNVKISGEEEDFKQYCIIAADEYSMSEGEITAEIARIKRYIVNGLNVTGDYGVGNVSIKTNPDGSIGYISQGLPDIFNFNNSTSSSSTSTPINSISGGGNGGGNGKNGNGKTAAANKRIEMSDLPEILHSYYEQLRDLNGKLKRVKDDISSKTIEIENINMGANFASGNNGGNIANAFTNSNGTVIDSKVAANMARLNAETDKKKNMINLSFMLNLLDGVLETPGRMMIITSNYPDKLDDAILRPGRIDIKIQFKRASVQVICDMLAHFYNMNPDDFKSEISANFDEIFTPAEIMDVCSNNYTDYKNAINELKNKLC